MSRLHQRRQSHEAWAEVKEREKEEKEYEARLIAQQKKRHQDSRKEEAAEKYAKWLNQKETYDRAVQLIEQIDSGRCREDEQWFETAIAFNAIDTLRGVSKLEEYQGFPIDRDPNHDAPPEELRKRRTLWQVFYKWSRDPQDGHEFMEITIPPEEARTYTAAAQSMMSEYAEEALRRKGEYVRASLRYTVPKVKQAAHDKRNLYNPDTAKFNAIFSRLCRQSYNKAKVEMFERLDKGVEELMGRRKASRGNDDTERTRGDLEKKVLYRMGMATLARWVEDDAIAAADAKAAKAKEDRHDAELMHKKFLAKKERMKVRIPDKFVNNGGRSNEDENSRNGNSRKSRVSGRMDFSVGRKGRVKRRPKQPSKNSFEMIKATGGSNSRYIYCRSRQDLQATRKAIEDKGYIFKENYLDEDGDFLPDEYERALQENVRRQMKKDKVKERELRAAELFKEWSNRKEVIAKCVESLDLIDKPATLGAGAADEVWELVGQRLKAIDVGLLGKFSDWSSGYKSSSQCKLMWDSWPPNTCDTCSASSMVQTTLLKILNRPGLNFSEIFDLAVNRAIARAMYSDGRRLGDENDEEREKIADELELTPNQFARMMEDGGVVLTPPEVRILMTLFDRDGNGRISRKEFLEFTGYEKRPKARGDALFILRSGNLCVWEACDHVTGMTNAFEVVPDSDGLLQKAISNSKKNSKQRRGAESEASDGEYTGQSDFEGGETTEGGEYSDDSEFKQGDVGDNYSTLIEQNCKPLYLRSGKPCPKWVRIPLKDYLKRKNALLKLGSVKASDFTKRPPKSCQLAAWQNADRQSALDDLQRLSKKNKSLLNSMQVVSNGDPPLPPLLTLAQDMNQLPDEARQYSLILSWKTPQNSPKASFYILESAGMEGSKTHRNHEYRELVRDPPNATMNGAKPTCRYIASDLLPNKRYFFRIRAFNGYGPSPLTYVSFCTAPAPPPKPVVISSTATSVTLCWDENKVQLQFIRLLRDVFDSLNPGEDEGCMSEVDRTSLFEAIARDRDLDGYFKTAPFSTSNATGMHVTLFEYFNNAQQNGGTVQWVDLYHLLASFYERTRRELIDDEPATNQLRATQYRVVKCITDEEVDPSREGNVLAKDGIASSPPASIVYNILKASDWYMEKTSSIPATSTSRSRTNMVDTSQFEIPPVSFIESPLPMSEATEKPSMLIVLAGAKEILQDSNSANTSYTTSLISSSKSSVTGRRGSIASVQGNQLAAGTNTQGLMRSGTVLGMFQEPISHMELFQPVYLGTEFQCTVTGLEPGKSYQFRIQSFNSGAVGGASDSVSSESMVSDTVASRLGRPLVFHCPLPRPDPPLLLPVSSNFPSSLARVTADTVVLAWNDVSTLSSGMTATTTTLSSTSRNWTKVVEDWAREPDSDETGGVSSSTVRKTFMKYDLNGDGHIDTREMKLMFKDLGLKTSGPTFEAAFEKLDGNGNGKIEFSEFDKWWRTLEIVYKVIRDNGRVPSKEKGEETVNRVQDKVTVYQGKASQLAVGNLQPNTEYRFQVQHLGTKTSSLLSRPLIVTTCPEVPQQPVVVEADRTTLMLKWYPGVFGADTFKLEIMLVDDPTSLTNGRPTSATSRSSTVSRRSRSFTSGRKRQLPLREWTVAYTGKQSIATVDGLTPGAIYRMRVSALNRAGGVSDPSLPSQCPTLDGRQASLRSLTSKENASRYFTVDCTGDVVTGDTILFSERVFEKSSTQTHLGWSSSMSQVSGYSDASTITSGTCQRKFVTERTIAARVVNVNVGGHRTSGTRSDSALKPSRNNTTLVLQVLWSTVSNEHANNHILKTGAKLMRKTSDVFRFETFRARWVQEDGRWSSSEEKDIMDGLYNTH